MAAYTGIVDSAHSQEEVWGYLSDLRSIREWDASVADARLVAGVPGEVGCRYELDVTFLGRTQTLRYETVDSEPPYRIAFRAETGKLSALDEATVERLGRGSRVTWSASLSLRGAARVLEPALGVAFARLAGRAEAGLRRRLAAPAPAAATVPLTAMNGVAL